ncbi:Putative sodium:dicarboxylate symporter [Septoria linicola]|uniref:Amino acid transporter n=1 Tax=Septoria linicola TaxID=215465 RepID=A0A9Q9EFN4_9PEZI|nr:putative sodium:dicarboxylate symporter [Septoria linicola]USW49951.1 Putative sodium:dicarboxylate symporter [Septoria linicola]
MADVNTYEKSATKEEGLARDGSQDTVPTPTQEQDVVQAKEPFGKRVLRNLKTPGSALQIVLAAVLAIGIGLAVSLTVDEIPEAAPVILEIPGTLWLRALRATVLPLIITAIILAVQNLKAMTSGGSKLAKWTISYYVLTTILAVIHSMILMDLVWSNLMTQADAASLEVAENDQETIDERAAQQPHDIVVTVFTSFIPQNVFQALAEDQLLADQTQVCYVNSRKSIGSIEFLIKLAPIGVFFLILANLMTLDISDIGQNLGVLIGASLAGMFIHLLIFLPAIFFAFTRENPFSWWVKHSPAWITAWGSASSAATLPVTMKCLDKNKVPQNVYKFTAPLGCLINMDGTAIYFPVVVVFLAVTQGMVLNAGDYALIVILSVLSSIATTPIPSSSLVLTVIIADSVGIRITGMYAVVVAIDWFIDRFRTALNVSSDIFAARIMQKVTGITDDNLNVGEDGHAVDEVDRMMRENQAPR